MQALKLISLRSMHTTTRFARLCDAALKLFTRSLRSLVAPSSLVDDAHHI